MSSFVVIQNNMGGGAAGTDPGDGGGGSGDAVIVSADITGPAGALDVDFTRVEPAPLTLIVLDPSLDRSPTSVQVVLTGGDPNATVQLFVDTTRVLTTTTDAGGDLGPTSLPVNDARVGTHKVRATQTGKVAAEAPFTIARTPQKYPSVPVPDTDPVAVPGAVSHGTRHFVLQDLKPGGLGSYVFPINPATMTSPHQRRELNIRHTSSVHEGQFHAFEGGVDAKEWKLNGFCPDQAMHDTLRAYCALRRRLWLIDHRNRAWKVALVGYAPTARLRTNFRGQVTDWAHDYVLTAMVLDPEWKAPQ